MTASTKARKAARADRKGREFLRQADAVLARVIDAHPDFRPRAWMDELPPLDAFGTPGTSLGGTRLLSAIVKPAA